MTNLSLSLLGTTPQDVLLGSSQSFTVQNTSKTDTVNYKLKDSTTFGGELKPNETMEFYKDTTFFVNNVNDSVATVLYVVKYEAGDKPSAGGSGSGSTVDRELVTVIYTCKNAFTGASVGDVITSTQIIDVIAQSTVSTIWRNQTTNTDLASIPSNSDLSLLASNIGLTDAQLRASAINVNVGNEIEIKNESGAVKQHVDGATPINAADYYSFSLASGDFMNFSRSSNGEQYTEVSMDPLSAGDEQTIIEYKTPFQFPCYAEVEASMSQRTKGDYTVLEITDKDDTYIDAPIEYSILASYVNNFGTTVTTGQTTTTLTMVLDSAFDGYLGSWVDCYGFLDTRFNYTNLCVASISTDKRTLTFNVADEATIPSLTANPASVVGAKLKRQAKLLSAGNALGMRFSGSSATATSYLSRFGAGSIKESGTMIGAKAVTSGSSAVVYTTGGNGQVELKATTRYRIDADPEIIVFGDKSNNAISIFSLRSQFTAAKPVRGTDYYVRFRAISPISISRPIAKIVSITKSGTTTATVTTDVPHGLTTTSYVQIVGVRDQASASFPNLTSQTAVSSVINATQFTIVIGTASTVSSYGGAVILCNGQVTQQGLIPQAIQSVARNADGLVTLVGSATWSGFGGVGEYVNVYGVRGSGGLDLGVDGVYKVHNASTSTLILEPVKDLAGNLVYNGNAQPVTPVGAVINTTNAGGCVILRTTLRSHDMILATYSQSQIKIAGQGTYRP